MEITVQICSCSLGTLVAGKACSVSLHSNPPSCFAKDDYFWFLEKCQFFDIFMKNNSCVMKKFVKRDNATVSYPGEKNRVTPVDGERRNARIV